MAEQVTELCYNEGDLYSGFQVAPNAKAAQDVMQITPNEP